MVLTELCLGLLYDYNDLWLILNVNYNVSLSYVKGSKTRRAIQWNTRIGKMKEHDMTTCEKLVSLGTIKVNITYGGRGQIPS